MAWHDFFYIEKASENKRVFKEHLNIEIEKDKLVIVDSSSFQNLRAITERAPSPVAEEWGREERIREGETER